jgi:hypothetical protein
MSEKPSRSSEFIAGSFLALLGGCCLLYAYAWASMVHPDLQGLAYWTDVLDKMFRFPDSGLWTWPWLAVFFSGLFLIGRALVRGWRRTPSKRW